MDLLAPADPLKVYDPSWTIYSRNACRPPHFVGADAKVQNSMVTEGCEIDGEVDFSVLFSGVTVEEGAVVKDSIIMPGATIRSGAVVQYAIVAENAVVEGGAQVGARPGEVPDKSKWGITVIGEGIRVGRDAIVPPKAMVERDIEDGKEAAAQ